MSALPARFHLVLVPALLILAAGVLVACSPRAATNDDDRANANASPAVEPTRTPDAQASAAPDSDNDGVPDSLDGCPNVPETGQWTTTDDGCPDTIDDLVAFAASEIDAFWERQFDAISVDYVSPGAIMGYDGPEQTACGETVPGNAFYCAADRSIYFDQSLLDDALANIGDFAPVFILAHEWGHLVQDELGYLTGRGRAGARNELQADCLAGLFAKDAAERNLLEPGDTDEALALAFEAGDLGGRQSPSSHGTPEQRAAAFATGYRSTISECLAM